MVCTSDKQHLLDDIETTIMHSLMVESKMQLDLMDVDATWHPNDDLEDSDDDMFDHAISFTLIRTYDIISQSRYTLFRGAVHMTPDAFQALTYRLSTTNAFRSISSFWHVQQQVAVGLYQLGWSGNGGGVHDVAFACSCSWGSVHVWTDRTIAGLYKLNSEVVTFATEDEHAKAKAWVADKSGVEEWSRGWLVVDGTHINLAWKPALNAHKHYSYKGDYTFNIALVFLPHSLCIVKLVVGHPGSSHDVNTAAAKSRDLHYFNYSLSHIRVKAEHGIAYLKNCFQCLMGFRGNLYREEDHKKAAHMVQACIIAHTFASHYDRPDEVAEYLKASETLSEAEVLETTSGMEAYQQATKDARIQRRENQQQYKQEQAAAMEGMSQN
ncbi:hypothetical protein NDA11_007720 [Ustilago hordei]|uniref:DDE Tnp4 domain-containing protein n=1 Tax=Ustilago hordei TaxID=120017 RepID=I2FSQ2_USTHO|nr:hypothetical protein NDA10_007872 [Ustilago hordei]KAJ1571090.1 hypothetical protein NDA11_007720 [Ustilago hordei]KAJ1587132.1 hypothetical protein NDA15_002365 [Ustilago hordei]KAJ1590424.1 hypothetical protein NDA12_007193 [Ustilago hordei]UTT96668.1 hypothetical protein NDA17_005331 [Ustilago hordei]